VPGPLENRVALIPGAGGGSGRAAAGRLGRDGAAVVVNDLEGDAAEDAVAAITAAGARAVAAPGSVVDLDEVAAMLEIARKSFGRLDILVNNAGITADAMAHNMTDEQWHAGIDVTLNGTMRTTRAALRHMMPRRSGVIVNNASVIGWRAQAGQSHYAAAKAGVMALTRCAAMEAAEAGVRVNCVAPSLAMHPFLAKTSSQEFLDSLISLEAFNRAAEPWEVANVMVFLASDYSSYMTGEIVSVSSQHP